MKRYFLMAIMTGAMLASCSSDDPVSIPTTDTAISFNSFVGKSASRGETTLNNLTSFQVYGYNQSAGTLNAGIAIFHNVTVTREGNAAPFTWTYTTPRYWMKGNNYWFSAIGVGDKGDYGVPEIHGLGSNVYGHFDYNAADQKDIIWSTATRDLTGVTTIAPTPAPVDLSFNHALCRVRIEFDFSAIPSPYLISIEDIKLDGTPTEGTFSLGAPNTNPVGGYNTGAWAFKDNPTSYTAALGSFNLQRNPQHWGLELVPPSANNKAPKRIGGGVGYVSYPTTVQTDYVYLIPLKTAPAGVTDNADNVVLYPSFTVTLYQGSGPDKVDNPTQQAVYNHPVGRHQVTHTPLEQGHSYVITCTLDMNNIDPDQQLFPILFNVTDVTGFTPDENLPMNN